MDKTELTKKKLILYGAGYCGALTAELFVENKLKPVCFFDRNPDKVGTYIEGIPVSTPSPFTGREDYVVIVTILRKGDFYEKIVNFLTNLNYKHIYHIYDIQEKSLFVKQKLVICPDIDTLYENKEHFAVVLEQLSDMESKQTLMMMLRFMLTGGNVEDSKHPLSKQYFADDIYSKNQEEVFIDCGAFKGDVLEGFCDLNEGNFKKYIAIEPDKAYLPYLQEKKKKYGTDQIQIIQIAISDKRESLRLKNYINENSVIHKDGRQVVNAQTLDTLLETEKITFLKVDVEGYEKKLLVGAQNTIKTQKPIIAIAAYHKETDIIELLSMIKSYHPEYKFYLRSYMNLHETILYAIPKCRLKIGVNDEIHK